MVIKEKQSHSPFYPFSFLYLQALIGAAAVVWGQSDFVLALHFGISLISFAAVFLLTLLIFEADHKAEISKIRFDKRLKFHTIGINDLHVSVVYTGALVRHTDASLVCRDWPFCVNSKPFSLPNNMYEWIQMGHRFLAGLIFVWIVYITLLAVKRYKQQKVLYFGWIIASILITLQIAAGAVVVFTNLNIYFAFAHALFITCLFGLLSYFIMLITRDSVAYSSVTEEKKVKESDIRNRI